MYINDEKLNRVLHSLSAIVHKLKKEEKLNIAISLEKVREDLLMSIEESNEEN